VRKTRIVESDDPLSYGHCDDETIRRKTAEASHHRSSSGIRPAALMDISAARRRPR
jgi:hypothetical protein